MKVVLGYVLLACVVCYTVAQYERIEPRSRNNYPNPRTNFGACRRHASTPSFICDPDQMFKRHEVDQLQTHVEAVINDTQCPCSRHSCLHHNEGYKIGIALVNKIKPELGEQLSEDDENDPEKYSKWLLNQAQLYAHKLRSFWALGRCDDDVIIFFSRHDGVLYTAVGDVAKMKLTTSNIYAISKSAREHFTPNGDVFKGLVKIIKDYRSVFSGTYQKPTDPKYAEQRRGGGADRVTSRPLFGICVAAGLALFLLR